MSLALVMYEFKLSFADIEIMSAEQFQFMQAFLDRKYKEEKRMADKAKRRGMRRRR